MISGTAHEHRIKRQELLSETQLLENVFTEITQSDFLTLDRREEALERISPAFSKVKEATEEVPIIELAGADDIGVDKFIYGRNRLPFLIGLVASILGTIIVFILTTFYEGDISSIGYVIGAFVGSAAIITVIFLMYRFRESGEESSARSAMKSAIDFDQEVIDTLTRLRIPIFIAERTSGVDFIVTLGERKILIETQAHASRLE